MRHEKNAPPRTCKLETLLAHPKNFDLIQHGCPLVLAQLMKDKQYTRLLTPGNFFIFDKSFYIDPAQSVKDRAKKLNIFD